jgi:hypothetical protein
LWIITYIMWLKSVFQNQCIREKTGAQNTVKEIKQYQKKWLQHVHRMDEKSIPKQALKYRQKRTKERTTTEEEMEGPTLSWRLVNKITRLNLHEYDDDDDDDIVFHKFEDKLYEHKNLRHMNGIFFRKSFCYGLQFFKIVYGF